jgi:protocatechuate 3,4-dioxygenase beta subunit
MEESGMKSGVMGRRKAIGFLGVGGAAALAAACGTSGTSTGATDTPGGTSGTGTNGDCTVTPSETVGPFPSKSDFVRSDIREGKSGTPLALAIRVVNVSNGCAAIPGAQVEIWHVDAAGDYSQYGTQSNQTFLRGIQTTDASGMVNFTTIYPGWYQGRATHIHAEVTINGRSVKATQIAFPESINAAVHQSGAYASRGTNPLSNARDGIFADSLSAELVTPAGSPASGYSATFQIAVAV